MNKFLVTDLVVHVRIEAVPNLSHEIVKSVLRIVVSCELFVQVHFSQHLLQFHET